MRDLIAIWLRRWVLFEHRSGDDQTHRFARSQGGKTPQLAEIDY